MVMLTFIAWFGATAHNKLSLLFVAAEIIVIDVVHAVSIMAAIFFL